MIERLVRASVEFRRGVLFAWFLIAAVLLTLALRLELDALPDVTSNQVQVLTRAPGMTPEEVELRITRPLEGSLGGLAGLESTRSLSRYGLCAITLVFEEDVELMEARQLVAERVGGWSSGDPQIEKPELGPITGGLGEVVQFTVSSATRTPSELLELFELRAAPILKATPGVVEVNTWGGARRTFEVRADADRMARRGVSFAELRDAVASSIGNQPGATLDVGDRHVLLRGRFLPSAVETIAELPVVVGRDRVVRVRDVATVAEGHEPRLGAATRDGRGETLYVMAQMLMGANALQVTADVRDRMDAVRTVMPPDVRIEVVYDRSELILQTLRTVALSLAEGGALVALVLFLMLGSVRAGLIVALTIPVAMLGATAAMSVGGLSGNLMSLGAVDFGLLVDGAVVLVEHVFARAGARSDRPWSDRVADACAEVARPSFFAVAVILLVYVPVLAMTGVDGKLFRPMATTVVLALLVTLVFSLTFVPAASAVLLGERAVPKRRPWMVRGVEWLHHRVLDRMLRWPLTVLATALFALAATVVLAAGLGSELTPTLDEGAMVIQTTRDARTSIGGAVRQGLALEKAVLDVPEVRSIASRIGSPAVATDTMGLEQADIFVELAPRGQWRDGLTREALLDEVAARVDEASPGSDPAFTQPIQMRFNELLGGAPFDVVLSILSQDRIAASQMASSVLEVVSDIEGVVEPRVLAEDTVPMLEIEPEPLGAGLRGLSVGDVLDAAGALRLGLRVGQTYDGAVEVPVRLRLGERAPHPTLIGSQRIPGPEGTLVLLEDVARVKRRDAEIALHRADGEPRVLLGFNVRGRELGAVVADAQTAVQQEVPQTPGVRLVWGGQYETLISARNRLMWVVPVVLLLIATVLFINFRRMGPVSWVLAHIPFAAIGGVVALWSRGMSLSISAAIGFIALWGIAVMNGTVLYAEVVRREDEGQAPDEATLSGTRARVRAVTMTALTDMLGFLPMALATGVGAEVQRPLATVVVGGLITSTALTLVVLPTLRVAAIRFRSRWRTRRASAGSGGRATDE